MRLADYVINRLYNENIKHIFMVTGRGILYLTDAVARHDGMEGISVHHEQAGAFAAVAYADTTDSLGACLVSTGCAGTNTITGLLNAWQDAVPCCFVSGQNMLNETVRHTKAQIRTYGSQEADIVSIVEPLTKYSVMITDPSSIAYEIDRALYYATEGRKGPVWIDIPLDVQNMRIEPDTLERFVPQITEYNPSADDIDYIVKAINGAERPAILIGSGVRASGALEEIKSLVESTSIPLVYAPSAVDIYGSAHDLSIGCVGSLGGSREGNMTLQNSDLLLVIGHRMTSITTGPDVDKFARMAKVIIVDIDRAEHEKDTIRIDRLVIADAKKTLVELLKAKVKTTDSFWVDKCIHWKNTLAKGSEYQDADANVNLYYLAKCLSACLSDDTAVICDAGFEELIIPSTTAFGDGHRCIHPVSQGSMGYALPAAIGAYYAGRESVIAVIGDGSIMMNIQELLTIQHHNIPIKIIVINNNMYSVIRKRQTDLFRTRTIGVDDKNGVGQPDFKKIAESFGIDYIQLPDNASVASQLKLVLATEGSLMCEVMCVVDQDYLHCSYGRNADGKIVRRPLEDMSPFLPRETIADEMIIEPIDI